MRLRRVRSCFFDWEEQLWKLFRKAWNKYLPRENWRWHTICQLLQVYIELFVSKLREASMGNGTITRNGLLYLLRLFIIRRPTLRCCRSTVESLLEVGMSLIGSDWPSPIECLEGNISAVTPIDAVEMVDMQGPNCGILENAGNQARVSNTAFYHVKSLPYNWNERSSQF